MTGEALSPWLALGRDLSVKSVLLLLAAWALTLTMRRVSAAARHLVWLLTFAGLLLLPLLSLMLPPRPVAVLPAPAAPLVSLHGPPKTSLRGLLAPITVNGGGGRPLAPNSGGTREAIREAVSGSPRIGLYWGGGGGAILSPDWPALFGILWLMGVALAAFPLIAGWAGAVRRIRRCAPVTDPATLALAAEAVRQIGVPRAVALRSGPGVSVPVTLGLFRPVVLLPEAAHTWPAERLRVALLHEMAHVRRGDWAVQTAARLLCALFWHNPLVWPAARMLRAEAERACDDLVLSSGVPAPDYARHLLAVAQALSVADRPLPLAVPMAARGPLESRLRAVLSARSRRAPSRRLAACAFALAFAALVPLAVLRPAARAARRVTPPPLAPVSLPASPAPVRAAPVPPPVFTQPTPIGVPPMKPLMPVKTAALAALAAGLALPAAHAAPTAPVKRAPAPKSAYTPSPVQVQILLAEARLRYANAYKKAVPPLIDFATSGDVANGVAILFQGSHKSYVIAPGVSGSVTLDLHGVSFDQALSTLVEAGSQPLEWSLERGVYHIRPRTVSPDISLNEGGSGDPIYARNPLVSLDLKKVPIRQALDSLFMAGSANYTVAAGVSDDNNPVTVHLTSVPLIFALNAVLAASATPLTYQIQQGGIFVITPKHANTFGASAPAHLERAAPPLVSSLPSGVRPGKPAATKAP